MSNIIDKIQVSGVTYDIGGTGGGGNPTVELTQAEYDALVTAGTVSADTYYIITDAQAGDLTNYYTKTETNTLLGGKADTATTYTKTETNTLLGGKADTATTYTKTEVDNAITAATSTKQDTLVSGTNIKTINNTSLLGSGNIDIQGGGGGGTTYTAGTNIDITNNIISCTLNASNGNGRYSFKEGYGTFAQERCAHAEGEQTSAVGPYSHAEGAYTMASGKYSHTEGYNTKTNNDYEHASGKFNNSVSASTTFGDSGNTLFSVGNGTANNARHNAFEIRQNGDIYLNNGTNDVKLQEYLQIKAVKLTQAEYDALATKDNSTLYVIIN